MAHGYSLSRREFAVMVAATGSVALLGCGGDATREESSAPQALPVLARQMVVYRDPDCPCCEKWAAMAGDAGYEVRMVDHPDMPAIKAQYGVPQDLRSCHTAIVGDYAFEGHVPFEHMAKLLSEKPGDIAGLAVAGMPAGSPGMEVPSGEIEPYEVIAFGRNIAARPFVV